MSLKIETTYLTLPSSLRTQLADTSAQKLVPSFRMNLLSSE